MVIIAMKDRDVFLTSTFMAVRLSGHRRPLPCLYRYEDGSHSHSTIKLMFYYEHTIISYPREPSLISCGREVYVLRAICKELMVELLHSVCVLTL